jgi:ABC-2 type transport system ATP-binding protein
MKVEIRNLEKNFGKTRAVSDLSFAFESSHVVGFVGPNGAGKTTTMRILATLDDASGGDIFIDGVSVSEYPEKARPLIGFVPDSLPIHGDMTVHEYLDFFARAFRLHGRKRSAAVAAVEEFTNLTGIRDKLLKALSKGMKQRVSLARALVHDPPILVLDEPAAALDPRARIELRELLLLLAGQRKAILISSHILTELTEICNGVVIIEKGRLLESGQIAEVAKRSHSKCVVHIRARERQEDLHRHLLQTPRVESVKPAGHELVVELAGDEDTACDLLHGLVAANFRIAEFRHKKAGLEDIFMTVTKGGVQ